MKIGIITDVHNNIEALQAVRREFDKIGVEGGICYGDMIGIGPCAEETVKEVMSIPNMIGCVRGNHERYLFEGMPDVVPNDEKIVYKLWIIRVSSK